MKYNTRNTNSRSEIAVTIVAMFVLLLVGGISLTTISISQNTQTMTDTAYEPFNPVNKAEQAAMAGIKAAKGHIECHGIKKSGGLPQQYFVNGGRFEVAWDDINLVDSTVNIVSTGFYEFDSGNTYTSKLESVIDLNLLSSHNQQILSGYYNNHTNKPQPELIDTQ